RRSGWCWPAIRMNRQRKVRMMSDNGCWRRRRQTPRPEMQTETESTMLKTIQAEVTLQVPAQRAFRAWSETDELRQWFSEHADVALDDNQFTFWGRYQPDTPARENAGQRLLLAESPDH